MNDCDWMAAETLDDAKRAYLEQVGGPEEEMLDDPGEIAESQYDKLMFCVDGCGAPFANNSTE